MHFLKRNPKSWIISPIFPFLLLLFLPTQSAAQSQGLDEIINEAFMPFALWWEAFIFSSIPLGQVNIPIVLILLLFGAIFFTLYFGFINVRRFPLSLRIVRGKYDQLETSISQESQNSQAPKGEVNHFQALATAVSGTVGLGNISMVAVAISIGGPGATFWMIIAGLLGMSSKFVECTLGVAYRDVSPDGRVYGGPMYYLRKGLEERGRPRLGKGLGIVFALLCVGASLGGGNAFQSNQAAAQIIQEFGLSGESIGTILGCIFAALVGIVLIGGIKRIAKVTEKLVPFMALVYVLAALFILISHYQYLDDAINLIFQEAFNPRASISGGFAAVMIQGFRRAAFSNEAGAGSAAIAHSAVQTKFPATEGLVALLEPFIDTVVICTMTALVIIIFNIEGTFVYGDVLNNQALITETGERIGGVNLTSLAFDTAIPGFSYVLAIAVVLFAFSTMISWSYYGLQAWKFLFGRGKRADILFKSIFLLFTVLGSAVTLDAVIKFSDSMILALVFPNMVGLLFLFPIVNRELKRFLHAVNKQTPS